jgi:hypothetical protein
MTHYRYEEGVLEQQPIKLLSRLNPAPIPPPVSISTAEAPLTPLTPLTPRSKIFHNKLVAFSRQVAIKQQAKADDLLSIDTLHAIVRNPPQTHEQLRRIPGVERFFHVCTDTNIDLLAKIQKFMPAQE